MVTCQTHAEVHATRGTVAVHCSNGGVEGSRYKCGGQVLCSALGIDPVGSVYCISVL